MVNEMMPPAGMYVVSETVKNPSGDRRTRGEFRKQAEFPKGQRVVVKHEGHETVGPEGRLLRFVCVTIYSLKGYEHQAVIPSHPAFALLTAVLKPVEATVEEWMQLNDVQKPVLAQMLKKGMVTKEQVLAAKKMDDEEEG